MKDERSRSTNWLTSISSENLEQETFTVGRKEMIEITDHLVMTGKRTNTFFSKVNLPK